VNFSKFTFEAIGGDIANTTSDGKEFHTVMIRLVKNAEMEAANSKGNSRQLFQIVKSMTQKFRHVCKCIQ